eukprot:6214221-Pleurochrysis_carterae.AAC.1
MHTTAVPLERADLRAFSEGPRTCAPSPHSSGSSTHRFVRGARLMGWAPERYRKHEMTKSDQEERTICEEERRNGRNRRLEGKREQERRSTREGRAKGE